MNSWSPSTKTLQFDVGSHHLSNFNTGSWWSAADAPDPPHVRSDIYGWLWSLIQHFLHCCDNSWRIAEANGFTQSFPVCHLLISQSWLGRWPVSVKSLFYMYTGNDNLVLCPFSVKLSHTTPFLNHIFSFCLTLTVILFLSHDYSYSPFISLTYAIILFQI